MNESIAVLILIIFMIFVACFFSRMDRRYKPDENEKKEWEKIRLRNLIKLKKELSRDLEKDLKELDNK